MTVSKETMKKVKRLNKLEEEAASIRKELLAEFGDYFDGCFIEGFFIEDEPCGDDQGDGEWCNQYTGYICDSGDGTYYYPIEHSKKYLAVSYSF